MHLTAVPLCRPGLAVGEAVQIWVPHGNGMPEACNNIARWALTQKEVGAITIKKKRESRISQALISSSGPDCRGVCLFFHFGAEI